MKSVNIPEGYQQLMPYLILEGAAGFIDFVKKVFDAEVKMMVPRDEAIIMHAEVAIGNAVIMLADATSEYSSTTAGMFIYVDDADRVYKAALDNGATSIISPSDQPHGRSAGGSDKYGNTWWITSV